MPKFFLPPEQLQDRFAVLTGEHAAHAKVLRLRTGDTVTLCDGAGTDYLAVISDIAPGQISLVIQNAVPSAAEPAVSVSVYMAFSKGDKLEHVVQKSTELGAREIVAYPSSRCVAKPDAKSLPKKLERWQKIAAAAAEQSGRGAIPTVRVCGSFQSAVEAASASQLSVLFYENEAAHTFHQAVSRAPFQTAALMTGPEGGFSPEEVSAAQQAGMQICTLGRRILRCETAPLCALSALLYAAGEF